MTRLFGFAQLEFAGTIAVADGRYIVRDGEREQVLVIETQGAPPPSRRRRRRSRAAESDSPPAELPLTRVTAIRAFAPFENEATASAWLQEVSSEEEPLDHLAEEGIELLNRALHVNAVASGNPHPQSMTVTRAVTVRVGYGSGEEVADGMFTAAHQVDPAGSVASRRRHRDEELRPQQRLAGVLGGRERLDVCETLLLRARLDLDAGRQREAALQLRVGLEALLIELRDAVADPGHDEDMATIEARRREVGELANAALQGDLGQDQVETLGDLLGICERVLRRRRVLDA